MNKPLISIITINLNNKEGLKRTAETISFQSVNNIEWIVIDGLSLDGSQEVIERFKANITIAVSEKDTGIYNAMNKGIRLAKGTYCLFLNSGDCLCSTDALERLFAYQPSKDIVYFNRLTKENGKDRIYRYPSKLSFYFFYVSNLNHQSCLIRRDVFEKYGYYDETYKISADSMQLTNAVCKHQCSYEYIDDVFTVFEWGGISTRYETRGTAERDRYMREDFELYRNDYIQFAILKEKHSSRLFKLADKVYNSAFYNWYRKIRTRK